MADKNYISQVTLPNNSVYYVKDTEARELIESIQAGSVVWVGVTTTPITDGSATPTSLVIGDKTVAVTKGTMAGYILTGESQAREFIYNGEIWQELGGLGVLKNLAYKDRVSATYTPSGSNTSSSVSFTGTTTDKVLGEATTFSASGTSVSFGDHTKATVLKSDVTATVPKPSGTTSYMKTTTGTTGTTDITTVTAAGSLGSAASWTAAVTNENLKFSWTPNTPTTPCAIGSTTVGAGGDTIVTGITSATSGETGAISYISAVGTSGTNSVTFSTTGHTASVITGLGTVTVTDPTITVGTNDKVTAVTGIGTATAAAQKWTGVEATITSE